MKERLKMLKGTVSFSKKLGAVLILGLLVVMLYSCAGSFSDKPPIHPNPNMDFQPKKNAQSFSNPLRIPGGIVAYGSKSDAGARERAEFLRDNLPFYHGLVANETIFSPDLLDKVKKVVVEGNGALPNGVRFVPLIPNEVEVGRPLVIQGYSRFEIYCSACHGRLGVGDGLVVQRRVGMPQPPDLSSPAVMALSDGELFNIITHGRRNMPAYAKQIKERDRWAIISYVRSLQQARNAKLSDLPQQLRENFLKWDKQRKEFLKKQQEEEDKN